MSVFRASPWVSYEPVMTEQPLSSTDHMDNDTDMDAPQISTLREEETPPPQPKASRKKPAKPQWTQQGTKRQRPHSEDESEEHEEEEDQLIDDDEDEGMKPIPPSALPAPPRVADGKRKPAAKRKPRKSEKKVAEEDRKAREKEMKAGAPNLAPTMTWFEATPSESHDDPGHIDHGQVSAHDGPVDIDLSIPKISIGRKKASPRKAVVPRIKIKPMTKLKLPLLPNLSEDTGVQSESYAGTAASSPVTTHFEAASPEPEPPAPSVSAAPPVEEINLENVALPQYPLPSKPFPVQPPVKIPTGFAPVTPLDRSGNKVRNWRVANREIRGIAGGRWFARSWVGSKDSEFASAIAAAAAAGKPVEDKLPPAVVLPRLSAVSISAPPTGKGVAKGKVSKAATSATVSAAPSRAGSSIPDAPPFVSASTVRAPTKMRILQVAPEPSEGGDSDMAGP